MPHKHSVRPTHISPISPTIHTIPMQCPGPVSASSPAGAQRRERVRMLMLQGPRGPRRGRMPLRSAAGADLKPGPPDRLFRPCRPPGAPGARHPEHPRHPRIPRYRRLPQRLRPPRRPGHHQLPQHPRRPQHPLYPLSPRLRWSCSRTGPAPRRLRSAGIRAPAGGPPNTRFEARARSRHSPLLRLHRLHRRAVSQLRPPSPMRRLLRRPPMSPHGTTSSPPRSPRAVGGRSGPGPAPVPGAVRSPGPRTARGRGLRTPAARGASLGMSPETWAMLRSPIRLRLPRQLRLMSRLPQLPRPLLPSPPPMLTLPPRSRSPRPPRSPSPMRSPARRPRRRTGAPRPRAPRPATRPTIRSSCPGARAISRRPSRTSTPRGRATTSA